MVRSAAGMLWRCLILTVFFLVIRISIDRYSRFLLADGTWYSAEQLLLEAQEKLQETKVFRSTWIWSLISQTEGDNRKTICRQQVIYWSDKRMEVRTGTVLAEHNGRQYEEPFAICAEAGQQEERLTERVQTHGSAAVEQRIVSDRGLLTETLQNMQIETIRAGAPGAAGKSADGQVQEAPLVLRGSLSPENFAVLLEAADGLELYPAQAVRAAEYGQEVPLELEVDHGTHEMTALRLELDGIGLEIRIRNEQENDTCM